MNRTAAKNYAPDARRDFIQAVTARAHALGITEKDSLPAQISGDVAIIGGQAFPRAFALQRQKLVEDVARRGHLSLEERSNLYMWGYHRVLDSFQFHITLTDGIADAGLRALVGAGLRKALEGVLDAPLRIDALTLFKQENRNRPFSAVARLPFANVQTAQETA